MNCIKSTLVISSLFCFLVVSTLFADDLKHHQTVTFDQAVMINNTRVKEGRYRVTFDVQKKEVKFAKDSNGDVVLVTKANIETMPMKAEQDSVITTATNSGMMVKELIFKGHEEAAVFDVQTVAAAQE